MKKRKDIHCDAESARCRKSIRLDGAVSDLLSIMEMEEDSSINVPLQLEVEHQQIPFQDVINAQSNSNAPLPFVDTESAPLSQDQERGIVLYNLSNGSAPFFSSPSSTCFPIIINSHLFPGLKDRLSLPQDPWAAKSMEEKAMYNGSTGEPSDCLAVVPWISPQPPITSGTESGMIHHTKPMEAEDMEAEMMDAEDNSVSNIAGKGSHEGEIMVDGAEAFELWQQQQQHCLMPQFPQNMYTPFTW